MAPNCIKYVAVTRLMPRWSTFWCLSAYIGFLVTRNTSLKTKPILDTGNPLAAVMGIHPVMSFILCPSRDRWFLKNSAVSVDTSAPVSSKQFIDCPLTLTFITGHLLMTLAINASTSDGSSNSPTPTRTWRTVASSFPYYCICEGN